MQQPQESAPSAPTYLRNSIWVESTDATAAAILSLCSLFALGILCKGLPCIFILIACRWSQVIISQSL